MAQLLLEFFSEEIPSSMQVYAEKYLNEKLITCFNKANISDFTIKTFSTPRRFGAVVENLPTAQADVVIEKRGPRSDAPQKAIDGFAKSANISIDNLEIRNTPKGEFYFATTKQEGFSLDKILAKNLSEISNNFTWPKSMRWGEYKIRWVRPLHNILCLFDGNVVNFEFGHLKSNNLTYGHRFLADKQIIVNNFDDYKTKLKDAYVIVDSKERKELIKQQIEQVASSKDVTVKEDNTLLEEVNGLVEYPQSLIGNIDERFLELPSEVLLVSMKSHQKYFSTQNSQGKIAPYFVTVSNIKSCNDNIINGNERVLKARLEDAKFFWENDLQTKPDDMAQKLDLIVFHQKLGNMQEKTERIVALSKLLAVMIPHASLVAVERAAKLCKSDLASQMVDEFPELQGLMGSYYAKHNNEEIDVSDAIFEHYKPVGTSDKSPTKPLSIAVALADKIDSLAGLFAINERPTGSKDPFAMRRSALGVIRIILDNQLNIPLKIVFDRALKAYPKSILKMDNQQPSSKLKIPFISDKKHTKKRFVVNQLLEFTIDRFKYLVKDKNIRADIIEAVFDNGSEDNLTRMMQRINALQEFIKTSEGQSLIFAYKRAKNIVVSEEKKDKTTYSDSPDQDILEKFEEINLYNCFDKINKDVSQLITDGKFYEAMYELSALREPVDEFFKEVIVNCDDKDKRKNRLLLLSSFTNTIDKVANFSKISE